MSDYKQSEERLAAWTQGGSIEPHILMADLILVLDHVETLTAERDRARDLAVRSGAFDDEWKIGPRIARNFRVIDSTTAELIAQLSQEFQARWHDEYHRNKGRAVEIKVLDTYAAQTDWQTWTPDVTDQLRAADELSAMHLGGTDA